MFCAWEVSWKWATCRTFIECMFAVYRCIIPEVGTRARRGPFRLPTKAICSAMFIASRFSLLADF